MTDDIGESQHEVTELPRDSLSERDLSVEIRRHDGGFTVEAVGPSGSLGTLEADQVGSGPARATRFSVDAKQAETLGGQLLEAARREDPDLTFRWRAEGTGGSDPGRVELLRQGETADAFWRAKGETGPSEWLDAEDAEARALQADQTAAAIAELTGEPAPDLRERVRFLEPAEFEHELVSRGDDPDSVRDTLGVYYPETKEILVRESREGWRQGALVHEGLHAWREERAAETIPAPLNEALTQHFTEVIDPAAGHLSDVEQLPDGRVRLIVPGLEATREGERVEVVPAPEVYPDGRRIVGLLEARVGRERLLEYYRTGDASDVRSCLAEQLGRPAWTLVADAAAVRDWEGAEHILRGSERRDDVLPLGGER